ncbi:hypothetical protein AB0I94_21595 [Streptomyces sp. NPDC050147]|uniref:DUF3592 domain-containing protein n=1 Tax=Streptomyces sp. NPDC050147 TaxID=3155513 RepID=UPI003420057B
MSLGGKRKKHAEGAPDTRYRIPLAIAVGCYALAAIVGMYLVADDFGLGLQVPLWIVHGVLLIVLIRRLGAGGEAGTYAALFIVGASVMSAGVAGMARQDLTLQQRGDEVSATVTKERRDPGQGRKNRDYHYTLQRRDGTRVPGPEMKTASDLYEVGQTVTVIEDPEGELAPRTPGEADATGELLGASAFALAALGSVGWMTWKGSDRGKRREADPPDRLRKAYKVINRNQATQEEQEQQLREALRTFPADRRGYIKVFPESYPDVPQRRAARIAWEEGTRMEGSGNRGSWRFGETVVEEVPHD